MLQAIVIALVGVLALHDSFPGLFARPVTPAQAWPVALAEVGSCLAIALLTHVALFLCGRALDRSGSGRALRAADRSLTLSRFAVLASHAWMVLGAGWIDAVRALLGDLVVVDELVATAPPMLTIVAGWWSAYPIERRLHEAGLVARLDAGASVHPAPSRARYVLDRTRHDLLLIVVPLALIGAWSESVDWLSRGRVAWLATEAGRNATPWLRLAGAIVVLALAPLALRLLWSTAPLGPGEIRDRLVGLCARHGVRFRRMLVWRTHGMSVNGAVLGFFAPIRYVLLTDALLENLPQDQVEAVMAHEVGHVRRRHIPWLMAGLMGALAFTAGALTVPLGLALRLAGARAGGVMASAVEAGIVAASVIAGLGFFGWVSRRFERQADAFAVQHLSGLTRAKPAPEGLLVTQEAAGAMEGALRNVAALNHIPQEKFTWRHGSIAGRRRAIRALVGRPVHDLPIDRAVGAIKGIIVLAIGLAVALAAIEFAAHRAYPS